MKPLVKLFTLLSVCAMHTAVLGYAKIGDSSYQKALGKHWGRIWKALVKHWGRICTLDISHFDRNVESIGVVFVHWTFLILTET